jgi:hypothetical protein
MQKDMTPDFFAILQPTLESLDFKRVRLKSCIFYEELWRNGRLWFGCSFDVRDQYLEVSLGHLYWFRDVMPRVIILCDYSSFCGCRPERELRSHGLQTALLAIRDSFDTAITAYKEHFDDILERQLQNKHARYSKEFFAALGQEVNDADLQKYTA